MSKQPAQADSGTRKNVSTQATFGLPDFGDISAADIVPRTRDLLARLERQREALASLSEYTFDSLVSGHQALLHELSRAWSPISHLNMVSSSNEWQQAYLTALAEVTDFSARLAQDPNLLKGYRYLDEHASSRLDEQQQQVIRHALRDFRLAGVDLDEKGQARYRELVSELSALQARFANNVQACSDQWHWQTTDAEAVAGIPDDILVQAQKAADAAERDGWRFDLSQPTYQAVMTHARSEATRRIFYEAWMTRAAAGPQHDSAYDNTALIQQILALRQQLANLLDFPSYADFSLAAKMAGSVNEVLDFLLDLCTRSEAKARQDLDELTTLAGRELSPWDQTFYLERFREDRYSLSEDRLRPYFPCDRVVTGLFSLAERLYHLKLTERTDIKTWHDDVRFYVVSDADDQVVGGFYADLFARGGKRGGAWIDECIIRASLSEDIILPVGYLVCNFSPPGPETPSLLTHSDVVTLFHEFGHMLHHLLTRVDYPSIAGINGVPWDAVELPSQFMENFAWHYSVLERCSGHYKNGEPLPHQMFEQLLASRNVGAGLQMLRQLEFALFDFRLHADTRPPSAQLVNEVLSSVREQTNLLPPPAFVKFENSFSHIFAGGYAAGYYSYKWAEVLAADAFAAFDESGDIFDSATALSFRKNILEIGGSRDIQEAYVAFRGRPATVDALLQSAGIIAA